MTNWEFCATFAPCCSGDRNCHRFSPGDRVTFDGGASVYSVRAYTGTIIAIADGVADVRIDGYDNVSGAALGKIRHLKELEE